ncbi:site-specific integrase [Acidobacteria bacterium AH-259-L09]|nr:site-specific integrase [Acidobacteria bacterium AH-259-L09]
MGRAPRIQITKKLNRGYLTVQAAYAKNKTKEIVPLRPELVQPLKVQMARSKSEWVFVKRDGVTRLKDIRTAFSGACRCAKISDCTPHALRHTFATRLVTEGKVDLITVKALGRWKRLEMVERYANPVEEHKRRAITSIHFTTLFTTPENPEVTELPQVIENK